MSGEALTGKNLDIGTMHDFEVPLDGESGLPLVTVSEEYHSIDDLVLDRQLLGRLEYIMAENRNFDRLLEYGLGPKQKILLCGPPGTGKTLSSKVLASSMGLPLVRVELDSIVSSFLGETGSNLRKIFDLAKNVRCVLLFDEFDVLGKSRGDEQEHGEMKRVISSFMQLVDSYDGKSILVAATNYQSLLDPAVWRRFDDILLYDLPDAGRRRKLMAKYLAALGHEEGLEPDMFAGMMRGFSAADIAGVCEDSMRKAVLARQKTVKVQDLKWAISERKRRKKVMRGP